MCGPVACQQSLRIDLGVALRRGDRGVAEQFLDRAQIASRRQQMRRKGVAKRMRRGAVVKTKGAGVSLHRQLDLSRRKRLAAR